MDENDRRFIEMLFTKQTEQFQQYLGVITENFDHKLGLIAEGHQMLAEKLDRIEARIGAAESNFSKKIDGMAADLERNGRRQAVERPVVGEVEEPELRHPRANDTLDLERCRLSGRLDRAVHRVIDAGQTPDLRQTAVLVAADPCDGRLVAPMKQQPAR